MISKRIKSAEIDLYSDAVDRSVIHPGSNYELKKQRRLLKIKADIYLYKLDHFFQSHIQIEKSNFAKTNLDFYPVPKHLIINFKKNNPRGEFFKIKGQPTMSLRTIWLKWKKFHCFAKFDYPYYLGGIKRFLSLPDGSYSLYASDALRENWRQQFPLQPIWEEYFIFSHKIKNYRVLIRQDDYLYHSSFVLPLASYILDKIQKGNDISSVEIYKTSLHKVLSRYIDIALKLYSQGIALEVHGQNLLLECEDAKNLKFTGKFFYRDFSVVALCRDKREKMGILSTIEKNKILALPQISNDFLEDAIWKKFYVDLPSAFLYPFVFYKAKDQTNQLIYSIYFKLLKNKLNSLPRFKSRLM